MKNIRSGEILCVGTELLVGQIVNTNASWLARRLSLLGISSYYQTVVGDNPARMLEAMKVASSRSDLVVVTGGLGPTADDLTMSVAAKMAERKMQIHLPSREAISEIFRKMGRTEVTENNWKQAMMPEGAFVLPNNNGTAPGAVIEYSFEGREVTMILLPGPPSEMQPMFVDQAEPWIRQHVPTSFKHLFVRMIGIGESKAETMLLDLIDGQNNPTIAPYASEGEVIFRISQLFDKNDGDITKQPDLTAELLAEVRNRLGEFIYEVGDRKMPEVVKDMLHAQRKTISFAESCTAGLLSDAIAQYPGASEVFKGAIIAYDNDIKTNILNVSSDILTEYGAVSEQCAIAMATGCRDVMKTDLAISVTGIAGPDGGSEEKPLGTVWLAAASADGVVTRKLHLAGNRGRIRRVSALQALDLARRQLL
ncbi:MAG: competence/damage-inducible protein A [Clostridiaceae bacterium]|nr:competence/damage-inducible protein A [Clostridiaceae bacterium]